MAIEHFGTFHQPVLSSSNTKMDVLETLSSLWMLVCSVFGIIYALVFIIIVATHRECHTLTIFLVLNSSIAGVIANATCMSQAVYQLLAVGNDTLCTIRGFLLHTSTGILYHTLCAQALHRLFVTVYSTRRSFQTARFTISMVTLQWVFSTTFALPVFLTHRIVYQPGSHICQIPLEDSIGFLYVALIIFFIPLIFIVSIYARIVQYMKHNPFATTNRSVIVDQRRQRSELRLIRRILQLIIILFVLGFPYFVSYLIVHFHLTSPRPAMVRISYFFITSGQSASMLINLMTTDAVRKYLCLKCRCNVDE